jgi:hypothetical protein
MLWPMSFPGGSAWAMARDVQAGVLLVTERTFLRFQVAEMDQFNTEVERQLRDVRGVQAPPDDVAATQVRQRKMQRLSSAQVVLRAHRKHKRI